MIRLYLFLFATFWMVTWVSAQSTIDTTITHDGLTRSYRLYIPSSYNSSQNVPLLLNLHGYGSNNIQQETYGDFRPIADTANFLIVHPNGTVDSSGSRFWDAFDQSPIDDVGFLSSLIDTIANRYSVDTNRVYSTGMSNGGFMSHQLACRLTNRVTAIAAVAGSMTPAQRNTCSPSNPIPVMQIHGTNDATVPYNGDNQFLSVDTVVSYWVNTNDCSSSPTVKQVPDRDTTDNSTAKHLIYKNGNDDTRVELYKVIGGGHTWPAAPIDIGVTNRDFNASKVIWEFFNSYPKQDSTSTPVTSKKRGPNWAIYPNPSEGNIRFRFADQQKKEIDIYSYTGSHIANLTCACQTTSFTLPEKGVYMISVAQSDHLQTRKVLVR